MAWHDGDYPTVTTLADADIMLLAQSGSTKVNSLTTLKTHLAITSAAILDSDSTLAGTPANTTETTLRTYSLPAATLTTDGWFIKIMAWGYTGANANNKTIRLKFGASVFTSGAAPINNAYWYLETIVRRNAAGNQDMFTRLSAFDRGVVWNNALTGIGDFREPAENLNGNVTVLITGQNGTASASDVVYEGSIILLNS